MLAPRLSINNTKKIIDQTVISIKFVNNIVYQNSLCEAVLSYSFSIAEFKIQDLTPENAMCYIFSKSDIILTNKHF